mgnify:CR=1 FL=1
MWFDQILASIAKYTEVEDLNPNWLLSLNLYYSIRIIPENVLAIFDAEQHCVRMKGKRLALENR